MSESGDAIPADAEIDRLRRRLARERETRRQSEAIAEEALSRLYDADRFKAVLLGSVSHELRTPLTVILGSAELLTDEWDRLDDGQRRDFVVRIRHHALSLRALIEEIIRFTQLEAGASSLVVGPVDLAQVVATAVELRRDLLQGHRVQVDVVGGPTALGDADALSQVLLRLLDNAAMFAPEGTEIIVAAHDDGQLVRLVVSDEGPGIEPAEREAVFRPFYRSQAAHVLATHGNGLGLTVVNRLVERMGGTATIAASPAGGTQVTVTLGRAAVSVPAQAQMSLES